MKISVLIATVLVLCAPAAFAQPIFQCTTPNGKQIQLLDNGKTLEYSFGKVGKPEIVVRVLRSQARYYDCGVEWGGRLRIQWTFQMAMWCTTSIMPTIELNRKLLRV